MEIHWGSNPSGKKKIVFSLKQIKLGDGTKQKKSTNPMQETSSAPIKDLSPHQEFSISHEGKVTSNLKKISWEIEHNGIHNQPGQRNIVIENPEIKRATRTN